MLTIWHNPRCSKSRQTLALLEAAGKAHTIRLYLEDTPSVDEIKAMLGQLGLDDPRDLMRKGESVYKELGLKGVQNRDALIGAMSEYPKLIERPVVSDGKRAIIGRPPESVQSLIST